MVTNLLPQGSDGNPKIRSGGKIIPALSLDLLHKNGKSHIDAASIGAVPENGGMKNYHHGAVVAEYFQQQRMFQRLNR